MSRSNNKARARAYSRLKRDMLELERSEIPSIAAVPMENNISEWHVNIRPTNGVYSGVYFHLIMTFPSDYPHNPPNIKICTPIQHPNIFGGFLCLSMIRRTSLTDPYEGWSSSYSVVSILMQLQSFLFAEKIEQDGGYTSAARLSDRAVVASLNTCKSFKCDKCGHCHDNAFPEVKGKKEELIKVFPLSRQVDVNGASCQTTHTQWVGAYGTYGSNVGKVYYEAFIDWTGDRWAKNNIRGGLCRFGFGTERANVCGRDQESFGYGGTGKFSFANNFDDFGETFTKGDTITCAVDFDESRIYFAKNGECLEKHRNLHLPNFLHRELLYPILSFKNSRAEFNFGSPRKPCKWLIDYGFKSMEESLLDYENQDRNDKHNNDDDDSKCEVDWVNGQGIDIPELWVSIFVSLQVPEIFRCKFVCQKWNAVISKYNVMERNEIRCYFSKCPDDDVILGIGLNVTVNGWSVKVQSQMDYLSLDAFTKGGCRLGVWSEPITHWLPMVIQRKHSEKAHTAIIKHLSVIADVYKSAKAQKLFPIEKKTYFGCRTLQLVDTLINMMNAMVVQFVMDNGSDNKNRNNRGLGLPQKKDVPMQFCEKVVLGYAQLHHLLLYLQSKNKANVTNYANAICRSFLSGNNGSDKKRCPDLGKLMIYVMLSDQYEWTHICRLFVCEVMTRNVRWWAKDRKYACLDNTSKLTYRLKMTFEATQTSRRLCMFQVWFMHNCAKSTLNDYNHRMGKPDQKMRNGLMKQSKFILNSNCWAQYFDSLKVGIADKKSIDALLRFAVYNSSRIKLYHQSKGFLNKVNPPKLTCTAPNNGHVIKKSNQININIKNNNNKNGKSESLRNSKIRPQNAWNNRKK